MRLLAAASCAFLLSLSSVTHADTVTVFAAASLREAIEAFSRDFERKSGHKVSAVYAGSNALARQIGAGAPAEIFISADREWADHVEKLEVARAGSRRDLAGNRLVLVAPAKSDLKIALVPGVSLAGALGSKRLAMADPESVPAGKYAKAALLKLGAWDGVKDHIAPAENVRAALAFVAAGEAPLGIAYRTDAIAERAVRIVDSFPESSHPPIVYPMLVLQRAKSAAQEFAALLSNTDSRATWQRFGFTAAPR